jgi:hypothetical protein
MEPTGTQTSAETSRPAIPSALPPPPPPPPGNHGGEHDTSEFAYRWPVAGQLTPTWRIATAFVWGFVFVGFVAVWKTSRELGLSTWWLGPLGEPVTPLVSMLPFLAPLAMILLAINNVKWLPWFGLGAAALTALIGAFDLSKVPRLALVELTIAGAGALTAIAGFSGRYRR